MNNYFYSYKTGEIYKELDDGRLVPFSALLACSYPSPIDVNSIVTVEMRKDLELQQYFPPQKRDI